MSENLIDTVATAATSTAGTTGVLVAVTSSPDVQNVIVALISSLVIQIIIKVGGWFTKKRDAPEKTEN